MMKYDLIIIGGGAAGFFTAIQCGERNPGMRILILEKSNKVLSKVRISGGGRCNVTHACFDPREMTAFYPRGNKELRGPFHRFLCGDMMAWLEDKGVETKIEEDGRVFPVSDNSETIIDCFQKACRDHGVQIKTSAIVEDFVKEGEDWVLRSKGDIYRASRLMLATGSTPAIWDLMAKKGHTIIPPVPSLFTFNIKHPLLKDLPGLSMPEAGVKILQSKFRESGPLLITHWGLSGPGILKLSAWAARDLHQMNYKFEIEVDWSGKGRSFLEQEIQAMRNTQGKKMLSSLSPISMPKRLWHRMLELLSLKGKNYASLSKQDLNDLLDMLTACKFQVDGKSTFKDEFVTCGGVDTKEVHFKTMESKILPGLYLAGEVLNIDAVTGGFNFQAAWTESYIAAEAICEIS
ncbi:MAG: NAD(P)/FAD-dependent oxidoreductase [Bacteroidia bacterium]|nr:NAD(P)/FAD-dependent oxidoreductase [Bacteroidia bacterium]